MNAPIGRDADAVVPPRRGPWPGAEDRRPAVFLDRDGTLIEDVPYLADPAGIRLLPGAAEALVRLRRAGFARVLVTNQSGIGRGFFTEDRLRAVHAELEGRLAARGAALDGIYYCPPRRPKTGARIARTASRAPACCSAGPTSWGSTWAPRGWSATR